MAPLEKASLKRIVLAAAKELFMSRGYEAVGMREIAEAVGRQPVQIYRLNLSKPDLLAEIIMELNQQQVDRVPEICARVSGETILERVSSYLRELYRLDIQFLPIRSVGAAYGWLWNHTYEAKITEQVFGLLAPVVGWMTAEGLNEIQARCYGIWSVYYVGFRRAAIHGGSADECVEEITPTLEILLRANQPGNAGQRAAVSGDESNDKAPFRLIVATN